MDAEALRDRIGFSWKSRSDGWWLEAPEIDIRAAAQTAAEVGARLVTITARRGREGACRLAYHFDLGGTLLTTVVIAQSSAPSIVDVYPGADWVEREIHDYFGIRFVGRETLLPLVTREGDPPVFGTSAANMASGA